VHRLGFLVAQQALEQRVRVLGDYLVGLRTGFGAELESASRKRGDGVG
jgi:hypothetical protein